MSVFEIRHIEAVWERSLWRVKAKDEDEAREKFRTGDGELLWTSIEGAVDSMDDEIESVLEVDNEAVELPASDVSRPVGFRIPEMGDYVRTTVPLQTVHAETEEVVDVPAGTLCEIARRDFFANNQQMHFCLAPRFGGYEPGQLLTMQIDETDLIDGRYPFELATKEG